jgi:[ribosomal protein S18]-alanine N-acetyltransferase
MTIERSAFRREAWPQEWLVSYADAFPELFLVASIGGRLVGYSAAAVARGWGELVSLAVLDSFRRRGVARALLSRTVHLLERSGARGVSLMVRADNTAARGFYTAFGFKRVRIIAGYYEDGSAGIRMRLQLKKTTL